MSEQLKEGRWVHFKENKRESFGYVLAPLPQLGGKVKVHLSEEDYNNHIDTDGFTKFRYVYEGTLTIVDDPGDDYSESVDQLLEPLVTDFYLDTEQFDRLKEWQELKKQAKKGFSMKDIIDPKLAEES